jgi:hypothetical protein
MRRWAMPLLISTAATAIATTLTITLNKFSAQHDTRKTLAPSLTPFGIVTVGTRLAKNATVFAKL